MSRIEIRPETANELHDIRNINVEAFRDHPISQQTEHLIVDALRDDGALEVSLVAISEGRTVGHVAFSKAELSDTEPGWFLLGPVAVLPDFQGQGIGSALVESGLAELRARHAVGCVLVGDPGYYSRFGFSSFPDLSYEGVPHEYVLGLPFTDAAPRGRIVANKAFQVEPGSDGGTFRIRELSAPDLPAVSSLLDEALGSGFWDADDLACGVALVADADGEPIGVGTASLDRTDDGLVGHVRLVAVDPAWRRRGVATTLVRDLVARCEALGATSHLTYAWVHGADGTAPMASVLVEAGFSLSRRIEGFYSGVVGDSCPVCGQSPCVCPADLYLRK